MVLHIKFQLNLMSSVAVWKHMWFSLPSPSTEISHSFNKCLTLFISAASFSVLSPMWSRSTIQFNGALLYHWFLIMFSWPFSYGNLKKTNHLVVVKFSKIVTKFILNVLSRVFFYLKWLLNSITIFIFLTLDDFLTNIGYNIFRRC